MKREKDIYSPYQIELIRNWKEYLASHTALLKSKFEKLIERYHFDNLKNLTGHEKGLFKIEFFHGSGELLFSCFMESEEAGELESILGTEHLFPDNFLPLKNDFLYPPDMDIYYEEFRESKWDKEKREILFTWLAKTWMDCGGHHIGIFVGTWENNAASTFSLNFFNWDSSIELPEPRKGVRIPYPFKRDLTEFEIRQRTKTHSFSAYVTSWRYFERGNDFFEIGLYADMLSIRTGHINHFATNSLYRQLENGDRYKLTKKVYTLCNDLINEGYYEKERPEGGLKIHKNLIEWDFGYMNREHLPISPEDMNTFETDNIQLPKSYKWFIKYMNGVTPKWNLSHFRIAFQKWKKLKTIFTFDTLVDQLINFHTKNQVDKNLLPFADDEEDGVLLLDVKEDHVFYFSNENTLIDLQCNFENFIGSCSGCSAYFYPMSYHVEHNNAITLKKYFEEGGKLDDPKMFSQRNPLQDLQHKMYYETAKVLLENGADPNGVYIWGDRISREVLELYLQHGFEWKSELIENERLKNSLREKGGFEGLLD